MMFWVNLLGAEVMHEDHFLALVNMDTQKHDDARDLRSFVRDVILASSKKEEQAAYYMRKAIAKHPMIFHRMVRRHSLNYWQEVLSLADMPVNLQSAKTWFDTFEKIANSGELGKSLSDFIEDYAASYTSLWEFLECRERMLLLERVSDESFQLLANTILQLIDKIDFAGEPCLHMLKDPQQGLSVGYVPAAFLDLAFLLIDEYFNKYDAREKAHIIVDLLELKPHCSEVEKLAAFLNGSGPVVQKFFQLMGEHVESERIRQLVNELKSHIKPFPFEQVKQVLESSYHMPLEKMFYRFDKKPLAAATIAQVHRAYFEQTGKVVIVKIKRPDIEEKAKKEIAIIRSLTDCEGILQLTNQLEEIIREETDLKTEAQHLKSGAVYNDLSKGIRSVKLIEKYPPSASVLMMELAKGKSIHKFTDVKDLKLKSYALKRLYKKWLNQAFFEDGFFHADLHSGNLFYKRRNQHPGYLLTLLDFGSVGKLGFYERKALVKLGLGISMNEAQLVMRGFRPFEKMSCQQARDYYAVVENILSQNIAASEKTNLILDEALTRDFALSKNFLQFNRGKAFLEDMIYKNNMDLRAEGAENWQVSSLAIYSKMIMKKVPGLLKKSLFNKLDKPDSLLDQVTLDFAWQYVKHNYFLGHYNLGKYDICEGRQGA